MHLCSSIRASSPDRLMTPFVCKRPLHEADFACLSSPGPSAKLPAAMTESSLARFPSSPVMSMLSTSGPSALSRRSEPLPASAFRRSSSVRTRTHGSRTRSSPPKVSGSGPCYHITNTPTTRRSSATRSGGIRTRDYLLCPVRLRREAVPRRGFSAREAPMPYARATYRSALALWHSVARRSHLATRGTNSGERPARRCGSSRVSAHRPSAPRRLRHSYRWTRPS